MSLVVLCLYLLIPFTLITFTLWFYLIPLTPMPTTVDPFESRLMLLCLSIRGGKLAQYLRREYRVFYALADPASTNAPVSLYSFPSCNTLTISQAAPFS